MDYGRSSAGTSIHAMQQPAVANCERPFPQLPEARRSIGRKEDELGPSDQILGRDVADGGKHAAILRVIAIIAHHEVFVRRYLIDLSIVQRPIVSHLDDKVLPPIRQGFDILSERNNGTVAFVIEVIHDAFAGAWLDINIEDKVINLDLVAGKT